METKTLNHRQYLKISRDYKKAAKAVNLQYVSDAEPGITRVQKSDGFAYIFNGKRIRSKAELQRIKALVIPPAWMNVWICVSPNGHIQVTGFDVKNRKQYRYHAAWHLLRNETKFHRLLEFGKTIPTLRLKLEKDLGQQSLTAEKVIAAVTALMERTYIRIGNQEYEKQNGSYGLTTLKDKHVNINGSKMVFSFKGKKGVYHDIALTNRKLAKIVKQCRDISGKELFQYYDADGSRKKIDSGMVNSYIKEVTGGDFTAKDFRTWAGTLSILRAFKSIGEATTSTEIKKNVVTALDEVSSKLGNTRTVCKKYYVHPGIIKMYEENNLGKYLNQLDEIEKDDNVTGYTSEENLLMKILQSIKNG